MPRALRVWLTLWVAVASPAPAAAQADFTSQQRSVTANSDRQLHLWEEGTNPFPPDLDPQTAIHTVDHSDQVQAPGFGAFSETVVSSTPPVAGIVEPVSTASAAQTSTLSPGGITASGSFSGDGDAFQLDAQQLALVNGLLQPPVPYFFGVVFTQEEGEVSELYVDFELSVATPFHLVGSVALSNPMTAFPLASGISEIELTGPSGRVARVVVQPQAFSDAIDVQGVLAPGTYTLSAVTGGYVDATCYILVGLECDSLSFSGSFDLSLTLAPAVPALSPSLVALLALGLAVTGAAALRRGSLGEPTPVIGSRRSG